VTQTTTTAGCCGASCTCTTCTCANSACTKPRKLTGALTFRRGSAGDREALQRLAALDSSSAPTGETVVAEHDGALIAAVTIDGRTKIADPFKPTATVIALLRAWSNQVQVAA
jgi:hypothetical protein